jgi:hypothetical protein
MALSAATPSRRGMLAGMDNELERRVSRLETLLVGLKCADEQIEDLRKEVSAVRRVLRLDSPQPVQPLDSSIASDLQAFFATQSPNPGLPRRALPKLTELYGDYRNWAGREGKETVTLVTFRFLAQRLEGVQVETSRNQMVVRILPRRKS